MNHQIANKFVAVAVALVMNGLILGGMSYLFDAAASNKAQTSLAQSDEASRQSDAIA